MKKRSKIMNGSQTGGKPLGGRKRSNTHEWAAWRTETCKPAATFNQYEGLRLLKRIGKRLPATKSGARWTGALIAHFEIIDIHPAPMKIMANMLRILLFDQL